MLEAAMYESELEEVFVAESERLYGIDRKTLLPYLFRRSLIVYMDGLKIPRVGATELPAFFMRFWIEDLAIPVQDGRFLYKGVPVPVTTNIGTPLKNIYDDLLHRLGMDRILSSQDPDPLKEWKRAQKEVETWLREAKRKSQKYRNKRVYPFVVKKWMLDKLNGAYGAKVTLPKNLPHFHYCEINLKLTLEEVCQREIAAFNEKVEDAELVAESELERYVMEHLEDIESGLKLVGHQYLLPNGRIDILAKDREGAIVVVELKVEKDTDLIWQKWYYTEEIKKRFRTERVRFIAILPRNYPELVRPLLDGGTQTDIYKFRPEIRRGKIVRAEFERIGESPCFLSTTTCLFPIG
jgi:hypothetical protein